MDENEELVELLEDILGEKGLHYPNRGQISFNCPKCDDGRNKHNLEVNYFNNVFKCWACGDSDNTHGALGKLIDIFGTKRQRKIYDIFKPEEQKVKEKFIPKLQLPKEFTSFKDINPLHIPHKEALKYIKSRGITDQMIEKYNIGFACEGEYMGRVIVPSYDKEGELNYFVSRAWFKTKNKYIN
jgi:DNA primase